MPAWTAANKVCPAAVNSKARVLRTNKATSKCVSKAFSWWLMAVGVTNNCALAALALPKRATASNVRSAVKEGKVLNGYTSIAASQMNLICQNHNFYQL